MKNLILNLEGLQYTETQNKVKKQLEKINGVENISMDNKNKSVQVSYNWPATDTEIKHRLEENGFQVDLR